MLASRPEWVAFGKALEGAYELKARALLDCTSHDQYREVIGCLKAYEEVLMLNDLVVRKAEQLDEYRANTAEHDRAVRDLARAATLNTRFWGGERGVPVRQ